MRDRNYSAKSSHAFTLVELLVVIGIIAMLIGLLLPTLSKARQSSRTLLCKSNQRQLAAATHLYSDANNLWLPEYLPHLDGNERRAISSPIKTYRVAYADATAGATAQDVRPANHGVLYTQGYADAADIFYCPEQAAELWKQGNYPDPWLSAGTPGLTNGGTDPGTLFLVRSSYMYNPIPEVFNAPPLGREFRRYRKLSQMRPPSLPDADDEPVLQERPLFMDLLVGSRNPTVAHDDNTAWNIALVDGSVRKYVDADTAEKHKRFESLNWSLFGVFLERVLEKK